MVVEGKMKTDAPNRAMSPENPHSKILESARFLAKEHKYAEALDLFRQLVTSTERPLSNWDFCKYAHCLRKLGSVDEAIGICQRVLESFPHFRPIKTEYHWCMYYKHIKSMLSPEMDSDIPEITKNAIKSIMAEFTPKDRHSPRSATQILMAHRFLRMQKHEEALQWLKSVSPTNLSTNDRFVNEDNEEVVFYSQRELYYHILCGSFLSLGRLEEATRYSLHGISVLKGDIKLARIVMDAARQKYHLNGQSLFEKVLTDLGFVNVQMRDNYLRQFLKGVDFNAGPADREEYRESNARRMANKMALLIKELAGRNGIKQKARRILKQKHSVTELSDFAFCPASFAIKASLAVEPTEEIGEGSELHGRRYLDLTAKKTLMERYSVYVADRDRGKAFIGISLEVQQKLKQLLDEILCSRLVVCGHTKTRQKAFESGDGHIVGMPDYVFESQAGARFVVEEKFTANESLRQENEGAFMNHLVQINAYINRLRTLKADYGYLVYWFYGLENVFTAHTVKGNKGSRATKKLIIKDARFVRIGRSPEGEKLVSWALDHVKSAKDKGAIVLDKGTVHPGKCIHCSVNQLCYHKTGVLEIVTVPYSYPQ